MTYIIKDHGKIAMFNERVRARLYYRALNTTIPACDIEVEVYDQEYLLNANEAQWVRR